MRLTIFASTIEEGIGVVALKPSNLAESSHSDFVDMAATFEPPSPYVCKSPTPIPIPISTNRLLLSLV